MKAANRNSVPFAAVQDLTGPNVALFFLLKL